MQQAVTRKGARVQISSPACPYSNLAEKEFERHYKQFLELGGTSLWGNVLDNRIKYLKAKGCTARTISTYLRSVVSLLEFRAKKLGDYNKEDFVDFAIWLREKVSETTFYHTMNNVKMFFRWINDGELPAPLRQFRRLKMPKPSIRWDQIITPDEIEILCRFCSNLRDECLIRFAFDSCARVSEILNLQIKDIYFTEFGARVFLHGHKGERFVDLTKSFHWLKKWLDFHPANNDKTAFVFVRLHENERLKLKKINNYLKKLYTKAKLNKSLSLKQLRSSGLTYRAESMSDQVLKRFAGHMPSSRMLDHYIAMNPFKK